MIALQSGPVKRESRSTSALRIWVLILSGLLWLSCVGVLIERIMHTPHAVVVIVPEIAKCQLVNYVPGTTLKTLMASLQPQTRDRVTMEMVTSGPGCTFWPYEHRGGFSQLVTFWRQENGIWLYAQKEVGAPAHDGYYAWGKPIKEGIEFTYLENGYLFWLGVLLTIILLAAGYHPVARYMNRKE